jgi:tRNA(Ile)-lysidine synthase
MDHKKKLSDFFIDNKISLPEKSSITVLESGGVVAWLVGYRIDDRFKLDEQTQSAIAFTLHKPG